MAGRGAPPDAARNAVRIVVAGDEKTGKSSLIFSAVAENFPNIIKVLPPMRMSMDMCSDSVPVTIIDTSSSIENRGKRDEELRRADAVVLTYACDRPVTFGRLSSYWLMELRRLEVQVPVIVVGCMLDKRGDQQPVSLEEVMSPIMQQFLEIETCIECSALNNIQIPEVFCYAQKAVLHPTAPIFDKEQQFIRPQCVSALKRIFTLCDHDRDGALSDAELNDFQVKCFNAPLQPSEIMGIKRVVQEKLQEGVDDDRGLTFMGFLCIHDLFIKKGRLEIIWMVLRKYGYNNEIRLRGDQLPPPVKRYPDQCVELTNEAVQFLKNVFISYDADCDDVLCSNEFEDLFSTAPEKEAPYVDAGAMMAFGGPSLDLFLSLWSLMTLLDPIRSVETLVYIGYGGDLSSATRVTRRRCLDRKKQQSERTVYQCFVFGPKESGKSALLNSFIGRSFSETYVATVGDQYAVNVVERHSGQKKTLVLREISEDKVNEFLSREDALSGCDVAVFVHDSSLEPSWEKARNVLLNVARRGKATGYEVPCLIVAAKGDLEPYLKENQDSTRVSQEMGIEDPIHLSTMQEDLNNVFDRIVTAAEHPHLSIPKVHRIGRGAKDPHLSIPETSAGEIREHYHWLHNRSLVY